MDGGDGGIRNKMDVEKSQQMKGSEVGDKDWYPQILQTSDEMKCVPA